MSIGIAEFFFAKKEITKQNVAVPVISQSVGTPDERRNHWIKVAKLSQNKEKAA